MGRLSRTYLAQMDAVRRYRAKAQQTAQVEREGIVRLNPSVKVWGRNFGCFRVALFDDHQANEGIISERKRLERR
jgi:hypothetical protein